MSVRLNDVADYLRTTFPALTIGTGVFGVTFWIKFKSDRNAASDIAYIADQVNPGSGTRIGYGTDTDGLDVLVFPGGAGPLSASLETWYGCYFGRDGSNHHWIRMYPDSASDTPLIENWGTQATDWTTIDNLLIGNRGAADGAADMEIANLKIMTGVFHTDAQVRAELDAFAIQIGGYTEGYAWELEDVDADSHGLNERGGSGYNLTNSGAVAGASRPSQLEAAGGGGPVALEGIGREPPAIGRGELYLRPPPDPFMTTLFRAA